MSRSSSRSSRVYVGNLSSRTRERDIERAFEKFGRVNRVDLKNGFGFVEFDDARDAEDCVKDMDNTDLDGRRIVVESARGARNPRKFSGGRGGYRILVDGLDARTSWQDLKDFARKAGNVNYTDVWVDRGKKYGVIEYTEKQDFREALKSLDNEKLDGVRVRLTEDKGDSGSGGDRDRRSRSRSPRKQRSRSRSPRKSSKSPQRDRSRERERERSPAKRDPSPKPAADDRQD